MKRLQIFSLLALVMVSVLPSFGQEAKHDFVKWEKDILAYEQSDHTNPPPKGALLFIGSSTIRLWKTLAEDYPGQRVINRGFGGSEILDSTHFADRIVFPYEPKAIYFRAGGNDIAAGKAPEAVFEDFKDFVAKVHAQLPGTDIYFISWNPTPSRWQNRDKEALLNRLTKELAEVTPHVKYIEASSMVLGEDGKPRVELFMADKLHFNAAGYKLLAERVRPFLPKQE